MIGVGVYVGGYYSLMSLKDARLVLIVWLVGGLHALCGAIAYGAVAKRLPVSGGEYSYLTRCVHPSVGFIAGWISIIAGFTAPIAAAGLLIEKYVGGSEAMFGLIGNPPLIATVAILVAAVLNACHLKVGAFFNNGVIAIKFVCFGIFLCIGIPYVLKGHHTGLLISPDASSNASELLSTRLTEGDTLLNMVVSLFFVSLAYTGFNASIYLAGEIEVQNPQEPNRTGLVSRSMWMACLVVIVFYMLLNWVFLYGLSPDKIIEAEEGYVAAVAENIGGPKIAQVIRGAIILSAATSILAMMAIGPRVYAQMAEDGRLPKLFNMQNGVPRSAIAVQAILSCIVVWNSNIKEILSYLGLTLTACGALAVSSIWFAKHALTATQPVRWYEHAATALYVGGSIVLLSVAYLCANTQFWWCVGSFGTGALVYIISSNKRKRVSSPS